MQPALAHVLALLWLAGTTLAPGASAAPPAADVTIYRCVGADGQVVIGNLPCVRGEQQEVRTMVRPVDGTPAPTPPAPVVPRAEPTPARVVVTTPAAPVYECTRPDGSRYESEDRNGEPRWVPHWSSGYPISIGPGRPGRPGAGDDFAARGPTFTARDGGLSVPLRSDISIPVNPPRPSFDPGRPRPPQRPPGHGGHGHGYFHSGYGGGSWEYDSCQALPQAETCARLRDRRQALRTRFFNAQQVERDTLRVEERGLNARIDSDCRTY